MSTKHHHFKSLTGLRFIAALFVFILHGGNHGLLSSNYLHLLDFSKAVSFFFVLSGFVLGFSYHRRSFSFRRFFISRLARVWPVTVISLFFVTLILPDSVYLPSVGSLVSKPLVFISHILCIQSFIPLPSFYFGFNAVTWTISVELFFYLLFPFLNSLKFSYLFRFFLFYTLLLLSFSLVISSLSLPGFSVAHFDSVVWQGLIYINPFFRLPEFVLGIIGSRALFSYSYCFKDYISRIPSSFLQFVYTFSFFLFFWIGTHSLFAKLAPPFHLALDQLTAAICSLLLIYIAISPSSVINSILSIKPFVYLGRVSLSVYLLHQPLMIRSSQIGGFEIFGQQLLPDNFFSLLLITIGISCLSFHLIEKPFQRIISNLAHD